MDNAITLTLICIFGPVAAVIVLTLFFYALDQLDTWLTRRQNRAAMKRLAESLRKRGT
jgi:hypothetical protein